MCVVVSYFGEALPCALGVYCLIFLPWEAAAWSMRSRSTSRFLFSALASAAWMVLRTSCAALMGYLPA